MEKLTVTVTAIPVCCKRIAFHFAWGTHVLLVETSGDKVLRRSKRPMTFAEAWDMARALVALKIDQLVCGAMPGHFRDWFESKGVRVIDCRKDAPQDLFEQFKKQVREIECSGRNISVNPHDPSGGPDKHDTPEERKSR